MNASFLSRGRVALLVFGLLLMAGIIYFSLPDRRTTGERVGDAAEALPHGLDKAADQLKDRSTLEKAGDKLDKAADENRSREETRQPTAKP